METVLSDFVLVIYGIRNTVHIRFCRHRAVERGVEHRNHRHTGHDFSAALYAGDVAWHMERAEFRILFANTDDFVVDDDGGLEVLTAVEHSVSYRADFVRGLDCAVNGIDHRFEHKLDGLGVILHVLLYVEHSAVSGLLGEFTAVERDTLAKSFEDCLLGFHVDELVFERRTACVDNENFHFVSPLN